jgi:hypothetical protein
MMANGVFKKPQKERLSNINGGHPAISNTSRLLCESRDIEPINLGRYRVDPTVDLLAYDFAAMAVIYRISIQGLSWR